MIINIYLDGKIIYTNEKVFGIREKEKSTSSYKSHYALKYKANSKDMEVLKCEEE